MIRIAHLSDIHFGSSFNLETWRAVSELVIEFGPDLIVVSGDLVDHPSPEHLLAARCELEALAHRAKGSSEQSAELFVVPGNHDVFESGIAGGQNWSRWFERVFNSADPSAAVSVMKEKYNLDEEYFSSTLLGFPSKSRPQDAGKLKQLASWLRGFSAARAKQSSSLSGDITELLGQELNSTRVRRPCGAPVLVALLDSNPIYGGVYAAGGQVDNDALIALQAELSRESKQYVARIAVLHHHVLPIAFSHGGSGLRGEPMMVLRNAGAVLRVLADHKFDLILHGHWHKPQFARIDFGTEDLDSYPMAVAAAGSCAKVSADNPAANSINLISIDRNGLIQVKNVFYGAGQPPRLDGELGRHFRLFRESISAAKRRAYVRATERHVINCALREQVCEVTENGDLWVSQRIEALRYNGKNSYPERPFYVQIPAEGELDFWNS